MPKETTPSVAEQADERALQYVEALNCLSSVMRAASHVLVGLPPSEKEAKLRDVLSKAHDWYMAERAALAASQVASHSAPEPVEPIQKWTDADGTSWEGVRGGPWKRTPPSGPQCRDCADFGPICPNSGRRCDGAPLGAESKACASVGVEIVAWQMRIFNPGHGWQPWQYIDKEAFDLPRDEWVSNPKAPEFRELGVVASLAPPAHSVGTRDGQRYRVWRDHMITNDAEFAAKVAKALPPAVGVMRRATAEEWDAAIDAATPPAAPAVTEPVPYLNERLQDFTYRRAENAGGCEGMTLYFTKLGAHSEYQLYSSEALALWINLGKALGPLAAPAAAVPESPAATDTTMWAVRIAGPDDLYAAPDRQVADALALVLNRQFARHPFPDEVRVSAEVVAWPHGYESWSAQKDLLQLEVRGVES